MEVPIWLAGNLSTHRRRRILQDVLPAQSLENQPPSLGLCLLFGTDFQQAEEKQQQNWYDWSQEPGRTLLLIPPFETGQCSIPCEWEILRRSSGGMQQSFPLLKALAPEVRYELRGQLQVATQIGGAWDDLSINTAYYHQHPHSGIFAITCLPLWSLAVLDREQELQTWLEELYSLAGQPIVAEAIEQTSFELKPEHFTVMLHLVTDQFPNQKAALSALQNSTIFSIDPKQAQSCLTELHSQGLVEGGQLTERGLETIRHSPYLAYAQALEASVS